MHFLLGFITALILLVAAALAVIWSGAYNIAASEPHTALVRRALDTTMRNSVKRRAESIEAPARFTEEQVRNGFKAFDAMCVQCHGAPGVKPEHWSVGMRPQPPDLSDKAKHWSSAQIFWILRNGLKMTGMPALAPTHSDETLWEVVAFVEELPTLAPDDYARLRKELGTGGH